MTAITRNTTRTIKRIKTFLASALALTLALAMLFPLAWMVFSGFKEHAAVNAVPFRLLPEEWTASNYEFIFNNGKLDLIKAMFWTFLSAAFGTVFSLLINTLTGYVFARMNFYGKKFLFACFVVQMFVPGMTTTVASYILVYQMGILQTFWVLVLPGLASGGAVFFFRQFFLNLPSSFEDAARIDGCGRFGIYLRVFLPMSKAPIIVSGAGAFIGYWNAWLWPTMTVGTSEYMQVMQVVRSYDIYFTSMDGVQMAASTLIFIPPMIMFVIFQKYITKGFVLAGLK